MDTRTRILHAAADLLARSPEADVSTRAVCEAAGVGAPVLYRQFGDKEGLLSAVVDFGFEQYLAGKRAAKPSNDPVRDLRDGWNNHVAFALENPNFYRLMYSPGLSAPPGAAAEAHGLLLAVLERCAAAGRLRVSPELAAQMVMPANAGVALLLITRPAIYSDAAEVSARVREAIVTAVTTPDEPPRTPRPDGEVSVLAASLGAVLRAAPASPLSGTETALLLEWLARLADA
ncbi:TetR/AcrR family transcriptional regulator [Plantactinospora sp. S1510]|uniref:TetR/AcrR family transcriptional regulator n=1 Tax=Plantactinospora alkalitolerans TaxID=2789879 RepID=A0ABS0H6Z1_9ACTN|nr:TetR/AcrR family transcriptional regulator [Plantactinospora alkalitolerans]MBF9134242.1 TetR/AcrR family transcriptional regulator [Plantactinospora alkalitolerans]